VSLKLRLAVFVHGCFWHGHSGCVRATVPKRNRAFWIAKFQRNRERDRSVAAELRRLGFRVVTVWECEVDDPVSLARRVRSMARLATRG
jgi:DNA mismatch endonuclease (patch repair protein)